MQLSTLSQKRLNGVHPDLVRVIKRAAEISDIEFIVTEGLRSEARQRELYNAGASKTLRSRHMTGHAVDLAVKVGNEVRWDWPLYDLLAAIVKRAATEEGVQIVWGGDWLKFKDGPHFELSHRIYP